MIEQQLLTTPWNVTSNFISARQNNSMLALKGLGDPSRGKGGISFLKMTSKNYSETKTAKDEIEEMKIKGTQHKTVTGTGADLRKLNKEEIKMRLREMGIDPDYINGLSRWDLVKALRIKSNDAAGMGYEGDVIKFARKSKMISKVENDAYNKLLDEAYDKYLDYLLSDNDSVDQSDSESVDSIQGLFEDEGEEQSVIDEDNEAIFNPFNKENKRNGEGRKRGNRFDDKDSEQVD